MAYGPRRRARATKRSGSSFGPPRRARRHRPGAACNSKEGGASHPHHCLRVPGSIPWRFSWAALPARLVPARHADQAPGTSPSPWSGRSCSPHHYRGSVLFLLNRSRPSPWCPAICCPVILVLVFIGSYTSNSSYATSGHAGVRRRRLSVVLEAGRAPVVLGSARQDRREPPLYLRCGVTTPALARKTGGPGALAIAVGVICTPSSRRVARAAKAVRA